MKSLYLTEEGVYAWHCLLVCVYGPCRVQVHADANAGPPGVPSYFYAFFVHSNIMCISYIRRVFSQNTALSIRPVTCSSCIIDGLPVLCIAVPRAHLRHAQAIACTHRGRWHGLSSATTCSTPGTSTGMLCATCQEWPACIAGAINVARLYNVMIESAGKMSCVQLQRKQQCRARCKHSWRAQSRFHCQMKESQTLCLWQLHWMQRKQQRSRRKQNLPLLTRTNVFPVAMQKYTIAE